MTEINRAGDVNSLGHIDTSQGEFRKQIDALTDAVRQLGGNPEIAPGGTVVNDPLSAPYILYVNSYTGSDKFVTGDYASADDGSFEQKMRRISNQRLECGYTEARPFKTINRAVIEAGIITSRDYLTLGNICGDLVTIVVMSGMHPALNGPGSSTSAWADDKSPTDAELQAFNPADGGIILPRGCSIVSLDLRKTNIYPTYVPPFAKEAADYSNRSAIFRVTGTSYLYGFTFLDKINSDGSVFAESHHLLDCFAFAGKARTDEFYAKIVASFGSVAGINSAIAVTRSSETQIVGPQPDPGFQDEKTDTVQSASPYIYNCSIRSTYGLSGIFANGDDATGFRSMVVAQFTGISLQKDMRCWQIYNAGVWGDLSDGDYADYIDETPDNVRMNPDYRNIHVRCVNRSIIQEVSVFAIGQGCHHACSSGGELTITNSNSNFGGVAALAEGFVDYSFQTDTDWNVGAIQVAEGIEALRNRTSSYFLGRLAEDQANNATTLRLQEELEGDENNLPSLLTVDGFSLNNYGGTNYLWIENPNGLDYYAPLAAVAWSTADKDQLNVSSAVVSAVDGEAPTNDETDPYPPIAGKRVYVRRLRDTRSLDQRRYSITCNNTATDSRNIIRDYGLQTDTASAVINNEIAAAEPLVTANIAVKAPASGIQRTNVIELRRAAASAAWDKGGAFMGTDESGGGGYHQANNYYRPGDVVRYQNKHWKCLVEHIATAFDTEKWEECFVHMAEDYAAEDFFKNVQPVIYFDKDQDSTNADELLGYSTDAMSTDPELMRQVRTATDYLGLYSFLRSLGFTDADSHKVLAPKSEATRYINPNTPYDGIANPDGAANTWDNWSIQFRRPSNIRLYSHAFEWAGQLNYTKALPQYQRDLTASNKFTYFFTNSLGGRVYVSGFNEEGFGVSPAGLTDLQTGETLSPEGIGADRDASQTVVFNGDVLVQGELQVIDGIESDQQSLVKGLNENDEEPSQGRGMSWIAPMESITDVDAFEGFDLNTRNEQGTEKGAKNTNGYSGPSFVTPFYLDTWRGKNSLLSAVEGPVRIFVNPRIKKPQQTVPSAANNESRNWNTTDLAVLLGQPPTVPSNAVKTISLAIEYVNATISTTTKVEFYLGAGIYKERGRRIFEHDVLLIGYDFSTGLFLTDGQGGGSKPWLGTINEGEGNSRSGRFPTANNALRDAVRNADNMPVFISQIRNDQIFGGRENRLSLLPLEFIFKKSATLQGLMWWGASETLRNAQGQNGDPDRTVPNSWFSPLTTADMESIKNEPQDTILNGAVWRLFANANVDSYLNGHPIEAYGELKTRDIAITAIGLPRQRYGRGVGGPVILAGTNAVLQLSGVTLIGNNHLRSDKAPTGLTLSDAPLIENSQAVYKLAGFAQQVMNLQNDTGDSTLTFTPCWYGEPVEEISNGKYYRNYNLTHINWHLINNEYDYPPDSATIYFSATPPTNEDENGPSFVSFLGNWVLKRRLGQFSYHNWRAQTASRHSGMAGYFGYYRGQIGESILPAPAMMTCSFQRDYDTKQVNQTAGNPTDDLASGTSFEFASRARFLCRNGLVNSSLVDTERVSGERPAVVNDGSQGYATVSEPSRLNIKYVAARNGLDSTNNLKANRDLLG